MAEFVPKKTIRENRDGTKTEIVEMVPVGEEKKEEKKKEKKQ